MLALTECHQSSVRFGRQGVMAAALGNPIVDWTALFDVGVEGVDTRFSPRGKVARGLYTSSLSASQQETSIAGLKQLRSSLFNKSEAYFDPFASPLLFFRTPSSELSNELPVFSPDSSFNGSEGKETTAEPTKKRRSLRKYPSAGSNLTLPHLRLEVGIENVLTAQGSELIDLMRRSLGRTAGETVEMDEHGLGERLELVEKEGLGLWDKLDAFGIGRWFAHVFRTP